MLYGMGGGFGGASSCSGFIWSSDIVGWWESGGICLDFSKLDAASVVKDQRDQDDIEVLK